MIRSVDTLLLMLLLKTDPRKGARRKFFDFHFHLFLLVLVAHILQFNFLSFMNTKRRNIE